MSCAAWAARAVHPHSRGELALSTWRCRLPAGSSPLAWGTRRRLRAPRAAISVHPHSRGELPRILYRAPEGLGSSPLAWGTPWAARLRQASTRFIPTRVGNSAPPSGTDWAHTVHPHSRGELVAGAAQDYEQGGSSPLAWGTRVGEHLIRGARRFIPTRVGNSGMGCKSSLACLVHPHSRGELGSIRSCGNGVVGSSPLAWGTLPVRRHNRLSRRFIPTRVGNSSVQRQLAHGWSVHPHSRGELIRPLYEREGGHGSSPLAWGTPR